MRKFFKEEKVCCLDSCRSVEFTSKNFEMSKGCARQGAALPHPLDSAFTNEGNWQQWL